MSDAEKLDKNTIVNLSLCKTLGLKTNKQTNRNDQLSTVLQSRLRRNSFLTAEIHDTPSHASHFLT